MSIPTLAQVHASIAGTIGEEPAVEPRSLAWQLPARSEAANGIGAMMFFGGCLALVFSYASWQVSFFPRSLPRLPLLWWPEMGHYAVAAALACLGLAYPLRLSARYLVRPKQVFQASVLLLLAIWAPAPLFVFKEGVAIYPDGVLIREGLGSPRDRWLSFDDAQAVHTACNGTTGGRNDRHTFLQGVSYYVEFQNEERIDLTQAARGWTSNYPSYWLNQMLVVDDSLRQRKTPRVNMLDQYGLPWVRPACVRGLAEELSPEEWAQAQQVFGFSADDIRGAERIPGEIDRLVRRKMQAAE